MNVYNAKVIVIYVKIQEQLMQNVLNVKKIISYSIMI
jgi:hypothetical protein